MRLVQQVCRDVAKRMHVRNELSPQDQERLIADLAGLKQWLEKRKSIILDPENAHTYGLSFPKGILLLGSFRHSP